MWPPPMPDPGTRSGGPVVDPTGRHGRPDRRAARSSNRDPTPPLLHRPRRRRRISGVRRTAVVRPRGRRATLAIGVLVPLLLMLVGTVFIAAALTTGDGPKPAVRPRPALPDGAPPAAETAPPQMTTVTIAPEPGSTAPVPTEPPPTSSPPADSTADTTTVTVAPSTPRVPSSPDVDAALTVAGTYLDAIASGDFEAASAIGDPSLSAEELAQRHPGIVGADLHYVDGALLGPGSATLRLVVVTAYLPVDDVVSATCVQWNVKAGRVYEVNEELLERLPGTELPADLRNRAEERCATLTF